MCIEVSGEYRNSLSLAEVAYLAGLIDGEGTIGIYRQTGTKSYSLKLRITNSSPALLQWLRPRFGGGVGKARKQRPWHRQTWQIVIYQEKAAELIELCRPFLVIKTAQADLGLRFIDEISRSKRHRVTDAEFELRQRYFDAMSELDHEIHETPTDYRAKERHVA